jgi:hypothetical protein
MDGSRFDHMARALGRRGSRRAAIGAALAAITGGAIVAGRQTSAQACAASGESCAAAACCAGLACDAKTKKCLGGPGATCRISSNCANGQLCKSGKCGGAAVCRALNESCAAAGSSCCTNLQCAAGKSVCLGLAGFSGCGTDTDCVRGLVCNDGICGPQRPATATPTLTATPTRTPTPGPTNTPTVTPSPTPFCGAVVSCTVIAEDPSRFCFTYFSGPFSGYGGYQMFGNYVLEDTTPCSFIEDCDPREGYSSRYCISYFDHNTDGVTTAECGMCLYF